MLPLPLVRQFFFFFFKFDIYIYIYIYLLVVGHPFIKGKALLNLSNCQFINFKSCQFQFYNVYIWIILVFLTNFIKKFVTFLFLILKI
jgi:hypothetical protein